MTKKDQAKKEVQTIVSELKNTAFTAKDFYTNLLNHGTPMSMDTVRTALKELVADGKIDINKMGRKTVFSFRKPVAGSFQALIPSKKKHGWKVKLARQLFSKTGILIKRTDLANLIDSDERNTHIMIGNMNYDRLEKINWNKKERAYSF